MPGGISKAVKRRKKPVAAFYVIAHNIRSLYNVGSIFRTADAFGVSKIYLTGYTGHPGLGQKHSQAIGKTALGAEKWVSWEYSKSVFAVLRRLKNQKVKIIALENNTQSKNISGVNIRGPFALVLGEETKGVPKALLKACDAVVEIPMQGKKESLNVSVAFGIAAYALS